MLKFLCIFLTALRVAFVGDPQVDNRTELDYARKSIYKELLGRNDLDLVVVLGDLVNENPSLIAPSEAILDSLNCPWVRVNGNHDGPDPIADTTFTKGGVRFILMNNVRRTRKKDYEGGLTEAQKCWLGDLLKTVPSQQHIVFCTHIPVSQSKGLDSLANITAAHKNILFVCGHTHQVDRHLLELGREEIIAGAACGTWWRGEKDSEGVPYALMNCGAPRGYFVLDFKKGNSKKPRSWYDVSYKCVGRPDDYTWRGCLHNDGNLYINVFGGSREGSVQVRIAGKRYEARHVYMIDPEVQRIIEFNQNVTREWRKEHKDQFIPMRRMPSPHIWMVENVPFRTTDISIRYRD